MFQVAPITLHRLTNEKQYKGSKTHEVCVFLRVFASNSESYNTHVRKKRGRGCRKRYACSAQEMQRGMPLFRPKTRTEGRSDSRAIHLSGVYTRTGARATRRTPFLKTYSNSGYNMHAGCCLTRYVTHYTRRNCLLCVLLKHFYMSGTK